jgi:DNA-binding NarL/FixJ family response regulator
VTAQSLHVLLLEHDAGDAELVTSQLDGMPTRVEVQRVESEDALKLALPEFPADVVLSDRPLNWRKGACAYSLLRTLRPAAPLIVLSRWLDEETIVMFLHDGPDDLVFKTNMGRLPSAIETAITARRPLAKLSRRQREVLLSVAEGRSTRAIADRLGLSIKTVESHRGAMMRRLGLHDVASLVRYAVRMGLVRSDGQEPQN